MNQIEHQVMRVSLTILKTTLSVRFPCSINYQLKYDSSVSQSQTLYQLKGGCCQPHQRLALDIEIETIGTQYCDSKVLLIVGLVSANGKVPAGSVSIPITAGGQLLNSDREEIKTIDKCADKLAKVTYRVKIEYIRTLKKSKLGETLTRSMVKPSSGLSSSNSEYFNLKNLYTSRRVLPHTSNHHGSKNKTTTAVTVTNKQYLKVRKPTKTDLKGSDEKQKSDKCISEKDNSLLFDDNRSNQNSRVRLHTTTVWQKLSRENPTEREREESKYPTYQFEDKINKYRSETQDLMLELNTVKQKNKYMERKERDNLQQVRELKEQIQKLKNKTNLLEENNFEFKLAMEEKEKANDKLNEQLKILKDYIDEVKASSNLQQKKIDYKELVYSEQAKKMTEKYQQSEHQRQKLMIQMNNMLSQYESSQKKSQAMYKERELAAIDDKNKLLKKIQSLKENIKRLEEQNSDQQTYIQQLLRNNNSENKNKLDLENQLLQATKNLQILTENNRKLMQSSQQQKKQLDQAKTKVEQLKSYPKRYSDIQYELNKLKQIQSRLNIKLSSQTKNIRELEAALKQASTAKESASTKNTELSKELHIAKKQLESKESDIQKLYETINGLKEKNEETKQKYMANFVILQQKYKKLEGELIYVLKKKENTESEYEQLKEKYDKNEVSFEEMVNKVNELNNKMLKLNEELFMQQQKSKTYQQNIKEFENNNEILKAEILSKEHKEKQLTYNLKAKSQIQFELNKTIKNKEKEITVLKEKQIQLSVAHDEGRKKVEQLQMEIKQLEKENSLLIRSLKDKINELEDEKTFKESQYQRLKEEYSYVKNQKQEAEAKVNVFQIDIMSKNKAIKQKEDEITTRLQTQKKISGLLKKREEELSSVKEEYKKYKAELAYAFQNFTTEFCNKETEQNSPVRQKNSKSEQMGSFNFAEQYLLIFQSKIIKNKKELVAKYRDDIKNLQQNLQFTTNELTKIKQISRENQINYEKQLDAQKEKFNELLSSTTSEKNELLENISRLQESNHDILGQKQKLAYQLTCVNEQLAEYKKVVDDGKVVEIQSEKKISGLQGELKQLEKTVNNLKKTGNSQLNTLHEEHRVILQKQKNNAKELEKKITKLEEQLQENDKIIKNLENSLSQKSYQLDRSLKNNQSAQKNIEELRQNIKTLKQQIATNEIAVTELMNKNQAVNKKLSAETFKNQDLALQLKKSTESFTSILVESEQLKVQISSLNTIISDHQIKSQKKIQAEKKNYDKSESIIKELKQKIISLESDIELKQFLIKQNETNYSQIKAQLASLTEESNKKKEEILELNKNIDSVRGENMQLQQLCENLQSEKDQFEREEKTMRSTIERLATQCGDASYLNKALEMEKKQNEKLKQEVINLNAKIKATQQEVSQATAQFRRESAIKLTREQDLRKKIRELQKQLSTKTHQFSLQSQKKQQKNDQQQSNLLKQVQALQEQNEGIIAMYENLKQQSRKQIQSLTQECAELTGLVTEKQELLCAKDDRIREQEHKCKFLQIELKNCLQAWESEKKQIEYYKNNKLHTKASRIIEEVDQRGQILMTSIFKSRRV